MLSERSLSWLKNNYGSTQRWETLLQDYTDDEIALLIKENRFVTAGQLLNCLYDRADPADDERRAHLKGFVSADHRRRMIAEIKSLQEKCRDPAGGHEH